MIENISFSIGDDKIAARLFLPSKKEGKQPAILFIHGWQSNQGRYSKLAETFSGMGFVCMTLDLRGHGESEGNLITLLRRDFLNDVVAVYDFLEKNQNVDGENIYAVGSSFGGYLAAVLSSKRKVKGLALRAPADYPDEGFDEVKLNRPNDGDKRNWRLEPRDTGATFALRAIRDFPGEILVIESGKDESIPHQLIANYINAVADKRKLTHVVMEGAPHSLSGSEKFQEESKRILINWFEDTKH